MKPLLLLVAALSLSGCSASYQVLRQAEPNPFAAQTRFAVMPLVGAQKVVADAFLSELTAAVLPHLRLEPADGFVHAGYTLKCRYSIGHTRGVASASASELTVEMRVVDSDGVILDEVATVVTLAPPDRLLEAWGVPAQPDLTGWIPPAADALGRYLLKRTGH